MALNLLDITSNNNDLTNSGAAEVTTSLPFATSTIAAGLTSSESDYLYAADSATLSPTTTWTVEMWVKFTTLPSSNGTMELINKGDWSTGGRNLDIGIYNNAGTYRIFAEVDQNSDYSVRDNYIVNCSPSLSTGTWYHFAVTCNVGNASATTFEFFQNGSSLGNGSAQVSDNCSSIYNGTTAVRLGCALDTGSNGYFLNGVIDEVRIWDDVRTSTEISNNKDSELTGSEANLVAYWPFETDVLVTTIPNRVYVKNQTVNRASTY